MVAGLAADRNRRPPTALLLAQGFETIADQMADRRTPEPRRRARHHRRPRRPGDQPDAAGPVERPPDAAGVGSDPTVRSTRRPAYLPPGPAAGQADPYAMSLISAAAEPTTPPRRGVAYYLLLGIGALALFAISMFVTILLLRLSKGDDPAGPRRARACYRRGRAAQEGRLAGANSLRTGPIRSEATTPAAATQRHRPDHRAEGDRRRCDLRSAAKIVPGDADEQAGAEGIGQVE